jgi:protein tyrosine phosphatase
MKKPAGQENEILFKNLVDDCIQLINNEELIVIHCSAGVGRTGTLGTMIEAIRCARNYKELSIFEIVDNLRRHRIGCVQTFDQYNFIYQ